MALNPKNWSSFGIKLAERVFWTAAEAGLAVATTELANLPPAYAVPIATFLAYVKGLVAKHVGNPNDPALLPYGV